MKYSDLTGWERLIAEACRTCPELIAELKQLLEQQQPEEQEGAKA